MARCLRQFVNTVCQGLSPLSGRNSPKNLAFSYFSFFGQCPSRLTSTISPTIRAASPLYTSVTYQKSASLHTLCQQTFSPHHNKKCGNPDQKSLLKNISNCSVPVRSGTGSRGSMPHPTVNIPIAVIGPNCQLDTQQAGWANELLITLDPDMRHQLFDALREYEAMVWSPGMDNGNKQLTSKEMRQLAFFSGLPFVGFGTLDNLIMIAAGEYIDQTFGAFLGISTMAAAALGNMVSDVVGLGTAGYVENLARKVGVHPPKMSAAQLDMTSTKLTSNLGRVIGVLIGCTIGMAPLLFLRRDDDNDDQGKDQGAPESGTPAAPTAPQAAASQTDEKKEKPKKS